MGDYSELSASVYAVNGTGTFQKKEHKSVIHRIAR